MVVEVAKVQETMLIAADSRLKVIWWPVVVYIIEERVVHKCDVEH